MFYVFVNFVLLLTCCLQNTSNFLHKPIVRVFPKNRSIFAKESFYIYINELMAILLPFPLKNFPKLLVYIAILSQSLQQ